MPTKKILSKDSLVSVVRDTSTRNAATEVYATPIPVQENEITVENLAYRAVDASALDTGAVSSQKFAVGAWVPYGENIQRVPAPLRDYAYWIDVIDGDIELHKEGIHADEDIVNVSADSTGITMTPTSTDPARIYLTGRMRRPGNSKLYVDVTSTARTATISSVSSSTYALTSASGSGSAVTYTSSSAVVTQPFEVGKQVTVGSGFTPSGYSSVAGAITAVGGSAGAWTFAIANTTTGASSGTATASLHLRFNTAAAHSVVVGDTIAVTDSSRTIASSGISATGNTGNPVITVTVPTGHGIASGERLTLTTTGDIAASLPSGTYVPSLISATQLSITGTAPSASGGISGTMTIALSSGWVNGTYVVRRVGSQTIDVDRLSSRYSSTLTVGTNAAFTGAGSVAADGAPYGAVRVVWWATDELATNYRYIYPLNKKATSLTSTAYEASSVVVDTGTGKATLTLATAHDMQVGELVNVSGTTAVSGTVGPLDGQFTITDIGAYTISWVTAETSPTTARSLVVNSVNVGRASLEVYDYAVYIELVANSAATLVSQASVFEAIGSVNKTTGSLVQLTPNGVSLQGDSSTGGASVGYDLSSDADTVFNVQQYSEDNKAYINTAAIHNDGTLSGVLLKGDEVNIDGVDMVGNFATNTRRNGATYSDALSLLNRLARGIVYHGRWSQPNSLTLATGTGAQEYVISHGSFTLEDGRAYRIDLTTGGLRVETPSRAVFVEVRFSTTAFTSGNYGTSYHLSNFAGGSASTTDWSVVDGLSGVFHASSTVSAVTDNYRLPSGVPIYWSFIMRTTGTISTAITVSSSASSAGTAATALIVEDIGPSLLNDSNTLTTSATYVGALTSAGGPGTTTYTATKTITATETAYYDNYGRGAYGTSDPYTNQYSIYQGNPGTSGGTKKSAIEFPALGLTGTTPTVTGMRLYLKNISTYDGSCQVHVAPHGTAELSTTLPAAVTSSAVTNRTYSSGEGAWITLPSSLYAGFTAGTSKGFLVGITSTASGANTYDSTLSNYGYFQGVGTGMTLPPKLEVTYTYTA